MIKINKYKLISLIVLIILSLSILIVISEKYIISHRYIYDENINTNAIKALKEKLNDSNFITEYKIYYSRPYLYFSIIIDSRCKKEDALNVLHIIRDFAIKKDDMEKLEDKFFILSIDVRFYKDKNMNSKPIYWFSGSNKDGYKVWYDEIENAKLFN
ncbi:hypothetical protein [Thermoanaerobacterium thermosaccharolyticum]|uniref:Uncharacterized protein n=1 Tax=Thermoanaerobacterium thermosaccharolyticum M0795 TaxID=698948 RepID=L0IED0_THETR|nr:hypothetical protein [Thermoanaerobacterium thermosaccharolyticum]AGB17895.1 hypothetical protein Thethe_00160 [Thermoanaerobacterium thermosaccharolyticum M0795]